MTQLSMRSLWLYAMTARYLTVGQIFWRIWYRLIWWPTAKQLTKSMQTTLADNHGWTAPITKPPSHNFENSFEFLNRKIDFQNAIDWEHSSCGRLWAYNLHYFDFLNGPPHSQQQERAVSGVSGQQLIQDWIDNNPPTKGTGWEPYPTSLRIVNWVKWTLADHSLCPLAIDSLYCQAKWLSRRIEHHILANHLFANLKALCFAAFFFDSPESALWRRQALRLLDRELDEQFLADGAHFELSPMYHDIVLEDVLDLINLFSGQSDADYGAIKFKLATTASRMLRWSLDARHPDQRIAFFNDAAFAIAPSIEALRSYAARLSIKPSAMLQTDNSKNSETNKYISTLSDCGLVILRGDLGFAIFDAGQIGPDYQPGHAHADSLSFEYSWGPERVFVNSGTSTYASCELRRSQRSTRFHNTVEVDNRDSSQVWAAFRVAKRARTQLLESGQTNDGSVYVMASHDGYSGLRKSVIHTRKLTFGQNSLQIEDSLTGKWDSAVARFYLHPSVIPDGINKLICASGQVFSLVTTGGYLRVSSSKWYHEFGLDTANHCLEFIFTSGHQGPHTFRMTAVS